MLGTVLVTGCATDRLVTKTVETPVYEPEIYQACPNKKPTSPVKGTWADWWDYITDLEIWGSGCEATVKGGKEWQEKERAKQDQLQTQDSDKEDQWSFF